MLAHLEGCSGRQAALLRLRVPFTLDRTALWHLRPRWMQALALERGEGQALECLATIDELFSRLAPAPAASQHGALH